MSLGVHFALTAADRKTIATISDADELVELITEDIEERYLSDDEWSYQSDKAWDAIHRCLTDGRLLYESGPFPLAYAVLGGEALDAGEYYTACLVQPQQVREVSAALREVTRDWMHERFLTLDETDYSQQPLSEQDFEYTWTNFEGLREFFAKAAKAKRPVLFTTDA